MRYIYTRPSVLELKKLRRTDGRTTAINAYCSLLLGGAATGTSQGAQAQLTELLGSAKDAAKLRSTDYHNLVCTQIRLHAKYLFTLPKPTANSFKGCRRFMINTHKARIVTQRTNTASWTLTLI